MMDRAPRSELLKIIDSQREQLQRYEARLRDLVQAYKGLSNEKEALEASVKVLLASAQGNDRNEQVWTVEDSRVADYKTDPLNAYPGSNTPSEPDLTMMKEQLVTLTSSIATLTKEKSKLESSYVSEKKQLRQENEELQKKLLEEQNNSVRQCIELQDQLQELKQKLRSQQQEREREETDHACMLRELQKLVSDERIAKEQLELQLDEIQSTLKDKEKITNNSEQYEKQIRDMSKELEALRNHLKMAEMKACEPSSLLLELQQELAKMKVQYAIQVQHEEKRTTEAEENLGQLAQQSEERVSALESKLSELSEVVGNYERLRYQDQLAILRLKERVTQLDLENMALARATQSPSQISCGDDDQNLDAQTLANKIIKLKKFLKLANERSEKPVDIKELFSESSSFLNEERLQSNKFKEELQQMKEEFERYKLRAQAILKNKNSKDNTGSKETESLKEQVSELREKLKSIHFQNEDAIKKQLLKEEDLRKALLSLQEKHKIDIAQVQSEYNQQQAELELELKKQRQRTVSMLAEKDREIESLQTSRRPNYDHEYLAAEGTGHLVREADALVSSSEEQQAVNRLLLSPTSSQGELMLLHYSEERARKEVEISILRKQKHHLETSLRELQNTFLVSEEKSTDERDSLKEQIWKLERDRSREGANLEYLKNVIFKFLICHDHMGKQQMLNAITTILQFSPKERDRVQSFNRGWWS